jgi:hypothetical protein
LQLQILLVPLQPGWWHSHHNESDEVAWVLPMQDAGLYTHQRTLDIRFVDDELVLHKQGRIRGSAFAITNRLGWHFALTLFCKVKTRFR